MTGLQYCLSFPRDCPSKEWEGVNLCVQCDKEEDPQLVSFSLSDISKLSSTYPNPCPIIGHISKKLKLKFTKAWMSFLKLTLPLDVYKELLDTCLKSSYLPAYLAAEFAKRLSRLSLLVPPQGALVIIATIHNLLRRHPSINFLVHQEVNDEVDGDVSMRGDALNEDEREPDAGPTMHIRKHGIDPFNNQETDPAKSEAMRSSLWEIETLCHHYCPAVSRSVASLENDLTVRAKTCEVTVADFSSGSYATIFGDEIQRRIKQVPLAFYKATPSSLFRESEFVGWAFGEVHSDKDKSYEENGVFNTAGNGDLRHIKRQRIESH